ncbi:hypothetical protein Ddye_028781 [Dipteronia dyeriana]|uniref:Thioredoxin domain-containing protein n=1 Tax=Dipteronia dyeriana TaxID=168575 RepID=A0AAD9WK08_9ROSI|nr:hypothetical protein Ddye_028781 [Dipteronia dyeriana]
MEGEPTARSLVEGEPVNRSEREAGPAAPSEGEGGLLLALRWRGACCSLRGERGPAASSEGEGGRLLARMGSGSLLLERKEKGKLSPTLQNCLTVLLDHFTPVSEFMENEPAAAAESSTTVTNPLPLDPVEEVPSPPWPLIDDENVVAMTEKSYTDYMDKKRGVVLFFYDSNCPTCQKLAPEYAAVAEMLKVDEAVTFGMVDAYESARKFFIPLYPTMCALFPKGRLSYYDFQEMESTR